MTVGSRAQVLHGTATETSGGLVKKNLKLNKTTGEIVSKDKVKSSKKNPWIEAVGKAKKKLKITGFALIEGELLKKSREIYEKSKK